VKGFAYRRRIEKEGIAMNDAFEKRVRTAGVALWWVVSIAVAFLVLQWIVYLAVMEARPAWVLSMWGPTVDWAFLQTVWFWAIAFLKLLVWLMVLIALWLTFWARQLRRRIGGE
jgi:hypothetical protein